MAFTELKTESIRESIRAEAVRRRESLLGSKLDSARLLQEQVEELNSRLMESEADRAARLVRLQESEADRAARFEQITELTRLLKESEADRAARLDVIHALEKENARLNALLQQLERTVAVRLGRRIGLIKTR